MEGDFGGEGMRKILIRVPPQGTNTGVNVPGVSPQANDRSPLQGVAALKRTHSKPERELDVSL